jgi:hypothetical protein
MDSVRDDLARVFGARLLSLVTYGDRRHMAVVSTLTADDLAALMPFVSRWRAAGDGVPLLLTRLELERSLDTFPIEYGAIMAKHELVQGTDPFAGLAIGRDDLRRACERQVKSHLIHLREGLLETGGRPSAMAGLVESSAPAFRAVLQAVLRLTAEVRLKPDATSDAGVRLKPDTTGTGNDPDATTNDDTLARLAESTLGLPPGTVRDVLGADRGQPVDAQALMPAYLALTERLWTLVDTWRG